jgi:hypothetical protein
VIRYAPGQPILIRCEIQPGAFPTEYLVTFQATDGPVSGFVRRDGVERIAGEEGYIAATVKEVSADTITVIVQGSFFRTTGLAHLNREWADSHVQAPHA